MSEPLLKVTDLHKRFPIYSGLLRKEAAHVHAVNGVTLELKQGEVLGLVGESGSGKSTIGRLALGLTQPTEGEVRYKGKLLGEMDGKSLADFRRSSQMVFQDPYASLNPRKTILEAIGEGILFHGIAKNYREMEAIAEDIVKQVGLPKDALKRYPHEFSGGQQQRICIGRAIALNPALLICDEAVSALDVSYQAQVLNLFRDLKEKRGLSYLFISHDLAIVRYLADTVAVLYLGKVMEIASAKSLFSNPKHPYTRSLLSASPTLDPEKRKARIRLEGEIPSSLRPPSGCPFRTRCPFAREECKRPPPHKKVKDSQTGGEDHSYFCVLDD
ncbi:ABC transporter ATP-binding protein [Estrella lausannensis]|uniref:Oligopeptide transport ATP-binding protein AppF n=1 Tax=Estrella lausannensis TaxID=483423 RepID=A0A0H5E6M0_9BACT|nr:oligopeptide/dipeptide ABC transporter ATP-binding protein [Estrella lausannensis]CRX38940.1 Oligopeptide transport ATP-binding protein AppF [Estrella lausannensis]